MDLNLQIFKLAKKHGLDLAPNIVCKSVKGAEGGHGCPICFAATPFFVSFVDAHLTVRYSP